MRHRRPLAGVDQPLANQPPFWVNYTGGDTLTAAIVDRQAIYVGGHQRWLNNSYGHNDAGPGAIARSGIAALDPVNGLPLSWNPGRARGYGVYGFALTSHGLWVGSDTTMLGGQQHARLGLLPIAGGSALSPYHAGRSSRQSVTAGYAAGRTSRTHVPSTARRSARNRASRRAPTGQKSEVRSSSMARSTAVGQMARCELAHCPPAAR